MKVNRFNLIVGLFCLVNYMIETIFLRIGCGSKTWMWFFLITTIFNLSYAFENEKASTKVEVRNR